MKLRLITSSLLAIVGATLIGCGGGGGSDGVNTGSSSSGPTAPITTSGSTDTIALSAAAMSNLSMTGSVQGVTINSPPVITFQLVNSDNNTALTGFDKLWVKRTDVITGAKATGTKVGTGTTDYVKTYPNFAFSIAKFVPGKDGSPGKWVSYMVSTPTIDAKGNTTYAPDRPTTENNGTLEYLENGQYKYTFRRDIKDVVNQVAAFTDAGANAKADLGDLAYDPNAIHRIVIQVSGIVPGSKSSSTSSTATQYCHTQDGICTSTYATTNYEFIRTPVDLIYDWIPATGRVVKATDTDVEQREIVNVAACASCHNKFTFHGGNALKGWGGGRQETRQCVVCHTSQRKFGRTSSTVDSTTGAFTGSTYLIDGLTADNKQSMVDFPVMIHKIHMGEELTRKGYNIAGILANDIKYPQLVTNCAKCHSGDEKKPDSSDNLVTKLDGTTVKMATPQGNNWNTKPNRQACGACHDGINFNTGLGTKLSGATSGHGAGGVGGAQADDSLCSTCHTSAAIKKVHVAVTPQNRNSSMFSDCKTYSPMSTPTPIPTPTIPPKAGPLGTCNGNANVAWIASNLNNLPAGAIKVSYDIKSVARIADTSVTPNKYRPQMVFCIKLNGVCAKFNDAPAAGSTDEQLSNLEMLPNFMGAPSAYFVWAVPQDNVTAPADFNASASGYLRSIWNGKTSLTGADGTVTKAGAGTLTGPDANGYYTVTLTAVSVPDGSKMLTGGLGFSYAPGTTLPLTQTNLADYPVTPATAKGTTTNELVSGKQTYVLRGNGSLDLTATANPTSGAPYHPNKTGGLIVVAPDVSVVASAGVDTGATGGAYTARRPIVEDARCNNCHQELGAFNTSSFHAGQRNDGATCSWCHNPNRTSSGWSADSTNFVHGIHASAKRTDGVDSAKAPIPVKFTWHASSTTDGYWSIGYPGVLKNCEACHIPGSYDFSNPASMAAAGLSGDLKDKRLFRYSATGKFPTSDTIYNLSTGAYLSQTGTEIRTGADLAVFSYSPYVTPYLGTDLGSGFSFSATSGATTAAGAATLYESPTTTVCFACHTDNTTKKSNIGNLTARAHMEANGGAIYAPRGAASAPAPTATGPETCLTCHGPTSAANIKSVHSK